MICTRSPHLEVCSCTKRAGACASEDDTACGALLAQCIDGFLQLTQQLPAYGILSLAAGQADYTHTLIGRRKRLDLHLQASQAQRHGRLPNLLVLTNTIMTMDIIWHVRCTGSVLDQTSEATGRVCSSFITTKSPPAAHLSNSSVGDRM